MQTNLVKVVILKEGGKLPLYGSAGAAGADLYSVEDDIIPPKSRMLFCTGISMEIPAGVYGRIAPRSGLALKHGIDVMAGVVDSDYRGEIMVLLVNLGDTVYKVHKGDRIAQIIFENYTHMNIRVAGELGDTDRGANGYGSTGV